MGPSDRLQGEPSAEAAPHAELARQTARGAFTFARGWREKHTAYPSRPRRDAPPREGRAWGSSKWEPRHAKRSKLCELLRRAGFYARRHWPREGDVYALEAPLVGGLPAVDPWEVLDKVEACCRDFAIRPSTGGKHGAVLVAPRRCKVHRICAVCASEDATSRAKHVLVVAGRAGRPGALLHTVFTQRDMPPGEETCRNAWTRLEGAWQRLRTGERGERWRRQVYGGVVHLETTNGSTGASWHPHMHALLELAPGVDVDDFRDWLAREWRRCTELAAREAGVGDYAWQRVAGTKDGVERWCEPIRGDDEAAVKSAAYQVSKYASPALELEAPARIAEFMAWAHGRRLVRWIGRWGDSDVREWIEATVEYQAAEARRERVKRGDAPDVGEPIRGANRPVGGAELEAARDGARDVVYFEELGIARTVEDVDAVREWWRLFGEHRAALRRARDALEGPDDPRSAALVELRDAMRWIRLQPRDEARALWGRLSAWLSANDPLS